MALEALSKRTEVSAAFEAFRLALTNGIEPVKKHIGYQGGGSTLNVYWRAREGFWCALEPTRASNRYWCAFGLGNPDEPANLSIACEINSPHEGVDRRIAAAFARDARGHLSIVHSGKI